MHRCEDDRVVGHKHRPAIYIGLKLENASLNLQ